METKPLWLSVAFRALVCVHVLRREIETIRGGDPLPPAFRVAEGKYYLPNYLQTSLPKAGGYYDCS